MNKSIIFLRSNPINPDSRVEKEMNTLKKNGFNVKAVCWDRDTNYKAKNETINLSDVKVQIIRKGIKASYGDGLKNLIPFIKFQIFLLIWLIKNKTNYDIIHACDFDTAFIANISRFITNKKMVFDIFDYLSTDSNTIFKKFIKKLEDHVVNDSDVTIICTEQRKLQIKDTKPQKLVIIHNTPHIQLNTTTKPHEKIRIAYVGILQEHRLILEIANIIANHPEYELHIGGFGKLEKEIREISDKSSNIFFYGKISYEETLNLENNCDIMTAIYDPQIGNHYFAAPNKFYEALMLGKPLIMVKNTGMSDVLLKNNIGICIDYSSESFEQGLEELVKLRDEWPSIHNKMKKIYNENYSWKVMEKRLVDLYNQI